MHPGAAELLEVDLLADDHLNHARRSEIHRGIALDHHDHVAERGDVCPTRGGGSEEQADLRHHARELDLVVEDAASVPAAGEHVDLVGDARAGRVDEIEQRDSQPGRGLLYAHDLLHRPRAPAARLHGGVVGHHGDLAALDGAEARDHAVGRKLFGEHVGEQPVFEERILVEQQVESLARGQLVLLAELGQIASSALERLGAQLLRALGPRQTYLPLNSGSRFSKKALMPSFESSVSVTSVNWLCR